MIFWGGYVNLIGDANSGGIQSGADNWTTTNSTAPSGREFHAAVWTGSEMIVWEDVIA
jgi:hypothetical protein